jgi:hypothetical protein
MKHTTLDELKRASNHLKLQMLEKRLASIQRKQRELIQDIANTKRDIEMGW